MKRYFFLLIFLSISIIASGQLMRYGTYNPEIAPKPIAIDSTEHPNNGRWYHFALFYNDKQELSSSFVNCLEFKQDKVKSSFYLCKNANEIYSKNIIESMKDKNDTTSFFSVKEMGKIVVFKTDSLMILADSKNLVVCNNGVFAYNYSVFIEENYIGNIPFTNRYSSALYKSDLYNGGGIRGRFVYNEDFDLFSNTDEDIQQRYKILKDWIENKHFKIPKEYKGEILDGMIAIYVFYDKNGNAYKHGIVRGLDKQLNNYILNQLENLPHLEPVYDRDGEPREFKFETIYIRLQL